MDFCSEHDSYGSRDRKSESLERYFNLGILLPLFLAVIDVMLKLNDGK